MNIKKSWKVNTHHHITHEILVTQKPSRNKKVKLGWDGTHEITAAIFFKPLLMVCPVKGFTHYQMWPIERIYKHFTWSFTLLKDLYKVVKPTYLNRIFNLLPNTIVREYWNETPDLVQSLMLISGSWSILQSLIFTRSDMLIEYLVLFWSIRCVDAVPSTKSLTSNVLQQP